MNFLRLLLFPFSLIYGLVVWLRNRFYDLGWFSSQSFDIPIISVGNLEVGGSGKTPMIEYLIKLLRHKKIATLSRGYGRKTKGFRWVKENDDATLSGDEPLQIKNKYPEISVTVCEKRAVGIDIIKKNHELVLMDDAFQHRAVKPGFNILIFDYNRLNNLKMLLPAGNYRDLFSERKRAQLIIVSKCPEDLAKQEMLKATQIIRKYPYQKLFFTSIKYANYLTSIFALDKTINVAELNKETDVLLITGIAKSELLLNRINKFSNNVKHHQYPDHHLFTTKNMLKLVEDFKAIKNKHKIIITTEKDAVRLSSKQYASYISDLPIYKWPIEIAFLNNEQEMFDKEILNYVTKS